MNILLFSRFDYQGASSRVRTLQFVPYLRSAGHTITVQSLFNRTYLASLYETGKRPFLRITYSYIIRILSLFTINKYDLIYIEKELFPGFPSIAESLIATLKKPYIVDYDDAIFINYSTSKNYYMALLSNKIFKIMKKSSYVICGNEYLLQQASNHGSKRIIIVPSVVDLNRYIPRENHNRKVVIGWIGTPSTSKYLDIVDEVLAELFNHYDFELHVIGANYYSKKYNILNYEWNTESEINLLSQIDIGIMPLYNDTWEQGKCGYKLIQYMAMSKPVIASKVGENINIIKHNHDGFLAENQSQWKKYLTMLFSSSNKRKEIGKNARNKIEEKYNLEYSYSKIKYVIDKFK